MKIAFYKAYKGNWLDWLIMLFTFGRFSHVELIIDDFAYSSSSRDGGVRRKIIDFDDKWEIIELQNLSTIQEMQFEKYFTKTLNNKYDYFGVLTSVLFGFDFNKYKYYCSEWVAEALNEIYDLEIPTEISPSKLFDWVMEEF